MRWPKDEKEMKDGTVVIMNEDTLEVRTSADGVLTVVQVVDTVRRSIDDIAWDTACASFTVARVIEQRYEYPHKLFQAKLLSCLSILWMEAARQTEETFGKK